LYSIKRAKFIQRKAEVNYQMCLLLALAFY